LSQVRANIYMNQTAKHNDTTEKILATIVVTTSIAAVFLQMISGVCKYGARAAMHSSAAINL
jgi:hypothetical protein